MTIRTLAYIVKDQHPVVLPTTRNLQEACRLMWERCVGSVLVADEHGRLLGIFTGRDAVRALAKGANAAETRLGDAMTKDPVTISPDRRAIDALRIMSDGGFRHVPVIDGGQIWGIVSRGDFKSSELGQMEAEEHLWECIR